MKNQISARKVLAWLAFFALLALLLAPLVGAKLISPWAPFYRASSPESAILLNLRIPRVLTAFLAGAGLALSGMTLQAFFRNPLATPFTLGISSGAALGSAVYISSGLTFTLGWISGSSLAALSGALLTATLIYLITRLRGGFKTTTMLLAGVAVSFFFSSLILLIQYLSGYNDSFRIVRWLMGSLNVSGYDSFRNILPFVGVGTLVLIGLRRELDLMATGTDLALSRGVNVDAVKKLFFVVATLMTGSVVANCGPIGFVGMMAPHICRILLGSRHRFLIPATILSGGVLLVACDTLARTIIAPVQIPPGVITAFIGGPFFLALLFFVRNSDN